MSVIIFILYCKNFAYLERRGRNARPLRHTDENEPMDVQLERDPLELEEGVSLELVSQLDDELVDPVESVEQSLEAEPMRSGRRKPLKLAVRLNSIVACEKVNDERRDGN